MRKLAIDYGDKKIGLALSDYQGIIANPYKTYKRVNLEKDISYILNVIKEEEVDTVIFGLPLNMDGSAGERVELTYEFADTLHEYTDVKIVFQDERLTTVSAEKLLICDGVRREKRKTVIDMVAATIILQRYLDTVNNKPTI